MEIPNEHVQWSTSPVTYAKVGSQSIFHAVNDGRAYEFIDSLRVVKHCVDIEIIEMKKK